MSPSVVTGPGERVSKLSASLAALYVSPNIAKNITLSDVRNDILVVLVHS